MKRSLMVLIVMGATSLLLLGQAPKTKNMQVRRAAGTKASPRALSTYQIFAYHDTAQGMDPARHPGCDCGSNVVAVSPSNVTTPVNTPVQIRYDASKICLKQTIRDLNGTVHPYTDGVDDNSQIGNLTLGTVQWEVGAVSDLPLEWGIITYNPGYVQPTSEQIQINIDVQCFDTGALCTAPGKYQVCHAKATIPVTVR